MQIVRMIFYDSHLLLSNFLFPTYIFAALKQVGLSKWRYYYNFTITVTIEMRGFLFNVIN